MYQLCPRCQMVTMHQSEVCTICNDPGNDFPELTLPDMVVLLREALYMASLADARMVLLMDYCKTFDDLRLDEGHLEMALSMNHQKSVRKIGDYLDEIIQMDDTRLFQESLKIKLK